MLYGYDTFAVVGNLFFFIYVVGIKVTRDAFCLRASARVKPDIWTPSDELGCKWCIPRCVASSIEMKKLVLASKVVQENAERRIYIYVHNPSTSS